MLIQSAFNPLPHKQACNNGAVLMGSSVASMSAAFSQLTHVKFLSHANYPVMRSTYLDFGSISNPGVLISGTIGGINKGHTEEHKLFYATSAISTYLCAIVIYESGASSEDGSSALFSPEIEINIKALHDSGSGYNEVATADYGIRFDSSNSILLHSALTRAYVHYVESGINIPATTPINITPVAPRPLYIPVTAGGYDVRGNLVAINISAADCKIRHVTILDIYTPEVAT